MSTRREVLRLHGQLGLTFAEIAALLEISVAAANKCWQRLVQRIQADARWQRLVEA